MTIGTFARSLRPYQWVKNGVVFAPVICSGRLFEPGALGQATLSFLCFCAASSGAYLLNDVLDRRVDRFHPLKRSRPIATGAFPSRWAVMSACLLMGGALLAAAAVHRHLAAAILLYLVLNVIYSTVVKRIVILDVVTLAVGFVIRIWGGAVVLEIAPSSWLQLSMFFLALFMGLAKRRQELVTLHAMARRHRSVLCDYRRPFIDQLTAILAAVTIVCYALYAVSPDVTHRVGTFGFLPTIPVVLYAIFRYLYLVYVRAGALDPTEALWSDGPMALAILAWIVAVLCILYR